MLIVWLETYKVRNVVQVDELLKLCCYHYIHKYNTVFILDYDYVHHTLIHDSCSQIRGCKHRRWLSK